MKKSELKKEISTLEGRIVDLENINVELASSNISLLEKVGRDPSFVLLRELDRLREDRDQLRDELERPVKNPIDPTLVEDVDIPKPTVLISKSGAIIDINEKVTFREGDFHVILTGQEILAGLRGWRKK